MRINLLFGFLGSGKTTLARNLLLAKPSDKKMAVIVNEFGDVGIDGTILEGREEGQSIDMVELTSGCLCCSLKGSLLSAVEELNRDSNVDLLVIEATGVAEPEEMIETFSDPSFSETYNMGPMVTVVDAHKFMKIREILGPFYEAQVRNADVLVLNKIDLAKADDLETLRQEVESMNPSADIVFTERCDVDPAQLLFGDESRVMASAESNNSTSEEYCRNHDHRHDHDHRHAPAQSFVLDARLGGSREGLEDFFKALPDSVWRAKGFTQLDGEPVLVQFTMGQLEIVPSEQRDSYHMVFIGPDMNQREISGAFNAAMVSTN
tara:strand:+ start:663 stop:1625 length:963 start_codon:yes stop_codon:yes gene_type:complete